MRHRRLLLPLLVAAIAGGLATGCAMPASCSGARVYKPFVFASRASGPALFASAERAVRALTPTHLEVALEELHLEAIVDEQGDTRERIQVQVSDWNEVAIDLRSELRIGEGWIASTRVCDDYAHARERRIAGTVLDAVAATP